MSDVICAAIIGGAFGVAGTILGTYLGGRNTERVSDKTTAKSHKNALAIIKRQEFNKVSADFKLAFIDEIRFIDRCYAVDRAGRDIPEVLASAAGKHEKALIVFKGFLGERKSVEIQQAWKDYTGTEKLMGEHTFSQYAVKGEFKDREEIIKLVLHRINNIMNFAKIDHCIPYK